MPVRIIHGTEAIPVEHPIFVIIGDTGICKTSLGYSMPDVLLLDFDKGAHRAVNRRDTAVIDSWADFDDLLNGNALDAYGSVAIDTAGRMLDVITADIVENDPKKAPGGNLSQQGFGVLKTRFKSAMARLRAKGKDVLLIAHAREERDGDTRIIRADITGGSFGEVMKVADFVGYLTMVGKDRVLDFSPSDRYLGKNPAAWPPFKVPAPEKATAFMAELYARGRAALGAISGESAKVLAEVEAWRAKVDALTTADGCTAFLATGKTLSAIVRPQVGRLLTLRAKSLGLTFDKAAEKFVAAATPTEGGIGMHGLNLSPEAIEKAKAVGVLVDGGTPEGDDTKQDDATGADNAPGNETPKRTRKLAGGAEAVGTTA